MHTKYFSEKEIACKCGCGFNRINGDLAWLLDQVRERLGSPLSVTCVCRCEKHNAEVGGENNSAHLPDLNGEGRAVDFRPANSRDRYEIVGILYSLGVKRIGLYHDKMIVHADVARDLPQEVLWVK